MIMINYDIQKIMSTILAKVIDWTGQKWDIFISASSKFRPENQTFAAFVCFFVSQLELFPFLGGKNKERPSLGGCLQFPIDSFLVDKMKH